MGGIVRNEKEIESVKEALEDIKSLKLGKLLNEDLERSRNSVLQATGAFLIFSLLDVKKLKFIALEVEVAATQQVVILIFLFCLTLVLSLYYRLNAQSEYTDKLAARVEAQMRLRAHSKVFSEKILTNRQAVTKARRIAKKDGTSFLKNANDLDSVEALIEKQMSEIVDINKRFNSQLKGLNRSHYYIIISCIITEIVAAANRYHTDIGNYFGF